MTMPSEYFMVYVTTALDGRFLHQDLHGSFLFDTKLAALASVASQIDRKDIIRLEVQSLSKHHVQLLQMIGEAAKAKLQERDQ
jgi:hypothetical protein